MTTNIASSGGDDDLQKLWFDLPAGMIGNPNAIPSASRCAEDYTSGNPNYTCGGAGSASDIGDISVSANATCIGSPITLSGQIHLLRNQPSATPEVPTRLGIRLTGTCWVIIPLTVTMNLTAEIKVRPKDQGLRIEMLGNLPNTDPIIGGAIRINSITQTIMGTTVGGQPFLKNPTRCSSWAVKAYGRAYGTNTNYNADLDLDGTNDVYGTTSAGVTPTCTSPTWAPTFSMTRTSSAAGSPTGITAVVGNTIASTQPAFIKRVRVAFPSGVKINPAITNQITSTADACSTAQFNERLPEVTPTCPAASKVGTVSVATPLITGAVTGDVFLGQPGSGAANRYRLMVFMRNGAAVKFEARANVDANGDVTVDFGDPNASGITASPPNWEGLPQFPWSTFTLDFFGGDRAMLANSEICGTSTAVTTITPWSNQADQTFNTSFNNTAGANGSCAFTAWNNPPTVPAVPTFSANLSDVGAGKHPNLNLTVTRPHRSDNLRDLVFTLPTGMGGSTMATNGNICSAVDAAAGNCASGSRVGSVAVQVGGVETITMNGDVYLTTADPGDTAKLAIVVPANVGPFQLGNVVNYAKLRLVGTSSFALRSTTSNLVQSIEGIPISYRSIAFNLDGIVSGRPFLQNPSVCSALNFAATITSQGVQSGGTPGSPAAGSGSVQTANRTDSDQSTTGCASQTFNPSVSVAATSTATAAPTNVTLGVTVPQTTTGATGTTIQQSTLNRMQLTLPAGMEFNPAFASGITACPTATINTDITNGTSSCAGTAKVADVTVNTPLLSSAVTGSVYLETPGSTAATRYRFALYLAIPGGMQIVRGTADVAGDTDLPGGLGSKSAGTGQISIDFPGLPDVPYSSLSVAFNSSPSMLVNADTCGAQTFAFSLTPTNTSLSAAARNTSYATSYNGSGSSCPAQDPWNPTFTASVDDTAANAHPNLTMTVTRPDKDQYLRDATFGLPAGLTGAATASPTCTQAIADAANCTTASQVGTITAAVGSGGTTASLSGTLHNTVAPANAPAKLTAIINVVLGPFNLGKMALPVDISMRSDYGLDATVANLPTRYEGIRVRYRTITVVMNGMATQGTGSTADDLPFLTNPSKCGVNTFNAALTSTLNNTAARTATYSTSGCPINFSPSPTFTASPTTTETQAPTGLNVTVTSAASNPTIKRVRVQMPPGMTINPAVGNSGANTTCSTALIDAGGSGCPALSNKGTVSIQTPLLSGTFTGNVYLEDPGTTAATRYKLAMVVALPGRNLIIRGVATVDGATDGAPSGTGSTDTGTGQVVADFDNLPDLSWSNMTLALSGGARALLINPATCASQTINGQITPNSGGTTFSASPTYTTTADCSPPFNPTFSASLSTSAPGANPNLTLNVTNPSKSRQLRNLNLHLPTGLVADTVSTPRCSQANATAGTCVGANAVGTVSTAIGNSGETLALSGTMYNVVPNASEPARLQAVIPVVVGPYNLGKLSIPVGTSLRSDYGIDTTTQLPTKYEGIEVRIRSLQIVLNGTVGGNPFMINPTKCQTMSLGADMVSADAVTVTGSQSLTISGCPKQYGTAPTFSVTPSTTETAKPVGLTFGLGSTVTNPTTDSIAVTFPQGVELNPAAGNSLVACTTAQINAGGAACLATSANLGTVTLNTPLLPTAQTGNVFLETPGTTSSTRYRIAMVVHLPGTDLIIRGAVNLNGSTTIAPGGTGSQDTGTGQISTVFSGIPDLGFTSFQVAFNSGNRALFTNPRSCASTSYSAAFTPHGGGTVANASSAYTTTLNCSDTFAPTFSGSVSNTTPAGNPNLTLTVNRPEKDRNLRNLTVSLPTGLVAATTATTQCAQATATAGNCASNQAVGTVNTSIGTGVESLALSGTIYNVVPNSNEPARLSVMIPVQVGPFDLGKLTIPVSTSLRADFGVDATAQLPLRYEGIAVRIRSLSMVLNGTAEGNDFIINPSKCQSNTVGGSMVSETPTPNTVNGSWNFTTSGCPVNFGTAPTIGITPSTLVAGEPVGLEIDVNSNANNPTIKRVQIAMPTGLEVNPAFGNGLVACSTANVTAGTCNAADSIADVTMTSHLLGTNPTGKVYLETPGTTAADRYKLAMIIDLPGRKMVVRGAVTINGSTTIPGGGTGSIDSGTGQIIADFDNIPDLGFTNLSLAFESGPQAMVVNPMTCSSATFQGTITPNSGGNVASPTASYTPTSCSSVFDPTFTASVSTTQAAGHPDLTLSVTNPDKNEQLRNLSVQLPTGLVANTTATATRCSQVNATAGNCAVGEEVGSFQTSIGSGTGTYDLTGGKIYNVVPNSNEPARLQAVIPVNVGPFDLGKLSIPISTSLRADMGVTATTQLPLRYEGIAVRVRSMQIVLNGTVGGNSFMTNPSKCQAHTITGQMTSAQSSNDSNNVSFTTTGCTSITSSYSPSITASVNPNTAGTPTALTFGVTLPAQSSTTNRVQLTLPAGMEISPGVGDGLVACSAAQIDAGGAACQSTTANLGSIQLTTPLLPGTQSGTLYLETPGSTATDRYKMAMVIALPGRDLIIRGGALVNGSSNLSGGLGSKDTGTGQVVADFPNLPDLGFTNMSVAFNSGGDKLLVNPKTCATHTVNASITPNSGATAATPSATFSTVNGTCDTTTFTPTFTGSISNSQSASNPNLNLQIGNPNGTQELKSFVVHLPVGLVANTTGVPRCSQANADAGTCAATNEVGTVTTTIGSGTETYPLSGTIYNVTPNANQPARLQAVVPVVVGPFDLGKLSIPVPTSLNSDLSVNASATMPSRYEGIAVRVRAMDMNILGEPNGNKFMVAPTECGAKTVGATMTSDTNATAAGSFGINITGCPTNFGASPTLQVTPSTTVRSTPVNLTFGITSSATNPTIGRVQVAMPTGLEINPAFGNSLQACNTASINAGGDSCPAQSQVGTASLKTQLLDPANTYTGKVFLETPGTTAATRFKLALIVELPGADLIVRGQVLVNGSSDLVNGVGSKDSGTGQITADFDNIPDLGFTELQMAFNTATPMLINPKTCTSNTFNATISPSSGGTDATPTAAYSTTPVGCSTASFSASTTFSANVDDTTVGAHPNLTLSFDRTNDNAETLKDFDLELPVGLVASTTATDHCSQANAALGNCTVDEQVGEFQTTIGNGASGLDLMGQIYNVTPDANEPARLAAVSNVVVGPYDLGKLVIPIQTALRSDLGVNTFTDVPTRYEGIAVRMKSMDITLFGFAGPESKPFISNPSKCQSNTITGRLTPAVGTLVTKTSSFTTTGCPRNFQVTPTVDVNVSPSETTVPTALEVVIGSDPVNSTISRIQVALPPSMSVNAAVGNGLATCSTALINAGGSGCPASSNQGTVEVTTPLLGAVQTGNVYLEDPGTTGDTRYKLAVVVHLPGTDMIVRGAVKIDGSTTITPGGAGSVDTGTGQITTDFDSIPDLAFSEMKINFNTGPRALLTNPDTCGSHNVNSVITPSSGGSNANIASSFSTSFDGNGAACPGTLPFNPSFSASATDYTTGANPDLTLSVTAPAKNLALRDLDIHLPAGLVADTTAAPQCSQANAAVGNCLVATQVGSVTTKLGTGSETLDISGTIHNVVPNSDEPARLAAIIPVVVGPYDLGKLSIPVPTTLRGGDFGVDASAQIPTRYEGIQVRIAELSMTMLGNVGGNGFIKNPSKCQAGTITADMTSSDNDVVTGTQPYTVTGCPVDFATSPTIAISNTEDETAVPTGMTLEIDSDSDNPAIESIVTTMPAGMTLNPAVGNNIDVCSAAAIDAGGDTCPAASQVGSVELVTPLLAGTHLGKVFLETPGTTGATRYKLAVVVDLPGTNLVVRGVAEVDGSSDLTNGAGSVNTGTGRVVASFPSIPDLNFTHMEIAFDSGPDALLTNAEACGAQTIEADFTPQSGGAQTSDSDSYSISYDGNGASCLGSESFNPSFSGSVSTTQAAGNPDLTLNVSRNDKTQQLGEFNLSLPPGLVADTVQTPRCAQVDAAVGNCDANTIVGSVTTAIGTGSQTMSLTGDLHNVVPDNDEPARLAAVIDVQVGPYDLGKLSLPVETEIVTGALPSDLAIDTKTTIPNRYEGVPVRIRTMQIQIDGVADQGTVTTADDKPFMINPSRCINNTVTTDMISTLATAATGSFSYTTTGCPAPFNPSITTAVDTTETGKPVGLDLAINVPGNSSSVRKVVTTLPAGMEINPGVANNGGVPNGLQACDPADVDAGGSACPASSIVGDVTLDTPLLPNQQTGKVYLETPGGTPATRYKLGIYIDLPGSGDIVVHGQATVDGSGQGVNSGTGRVSATFDNLPDLQFSKLEIQFITGDNALLTNPKTCGAHTTSADLTPWSVTSELDPDADKVTRTASFTTDYDGNGAPCPGTDTFDPSFSASLGSSDQAASSDLTLSASIGDKDSRLTDFTVGLPTGLVANTTAAPQCTQANAAAGTCAAPTIVGSVETTIGAGGDPLVMTGDIHNVEPDSDEPARLAAVIDVQVGPYDLGKLSIPVGTALRAGNDANPERRYGVDATTSIPTRFEGVAVQVRQLDMVLLGNVGGNDFIVNPSKCGATNIYGDFEAENGATATRTAPITIGNCAASFGAAPSITASVNPSETAIPTDITVGINSPVGNQTISAIEMAMPEGMTINPAIGNGFGTDLTTCPTADLDNADVSACGDAQIGSVTLQTPLLGGTQTGKVYLEEAGTTAATRYRMAIVVDLPGQKLVVHGRVLVDGATDLTDGMGSTNEAATGQMTAVFDNIPDLGFTSMSVAFDTGSRSLLTNPESCGTQTVTATITPTGGSTDATPTADFTTSYDGSGAACPGSEPFNPSFTADVSTTQAAGNPDLTLTATRADKTEQLRKFDLSLPPGLVADTVQTPRCAQAVAALGNCAAASQVGSVTTSIGTGAETLDMTGGLYNVVPDNDEPARLAAVIDVQVGPYDLGKLSIPVTTAIVSGALPSDLAIATETTIPKRYEGIPVRVREMQIQIDGIADQGTVSTADDKPFMINPSQCSTHTVTANMESTEGTAVAAADTFTTTDCATAPYNPSVEANLTTTEVGKPTGLNLAFLFSGNSSSTKSITTVFPEGMDINPGVGNYGSGMTCDPADVDAGGSACPAASKLGDVKLDTPLLPTQQTGAVYLETPGNTAATRYKLGIFIDLPGSGDLVVHGRALVDGSSDVASGMGSTDTGTGQVTAEFDDLPDLQFSRLEIDFKTTGSGEHALLTNPTTCGTFDVDAEMSPWSRPLTTETASDSFTTSYDGAGAACPGTEPQNPSMTAELGDNNPSGAAYAAGASADLKLTIARPDKDQGIRNVKILLPVGLVGSADAAPTCDQADADTGDCETTEPGSRIGDVALKIGDSSDTFAITGGLFNTVAPSNRPAKFTFAADVQVGPFDFGKISVPVDVNIDSNDFSIYATTGDMPQRFEGIPVRINEMQMLLNGVADQATVSTADDKPFLSNPRSCSTTLNVDAEITSPGANVANMSAPLAGPFTGCSNLNLNDNTVFIENVNKAAEQPTALNVEITQGTSATQATMKDFSIDLPGFRLNAPAANGLVACSAAQLDAENCPANSQVGTAWIDTQLLSKTAVNPDNSSDPNFHSLWGKVYLETPGNASDGSDRYKLAIQLSGRTLITIRGVAKVNETTGEISTEFTDLPDIPFEKFRVELTGATNPLLLNPEGTVGAASQVTAASTMTSHAGTAPATRTSQLDVDAANAKTFTPDTAIDLSTTQSGAHPDARFTITRADGQEDIKNVSMSLPQGFLGSAAAVPQCSLANAAAGTCSSSSKVGTVQAKIGQAGQVLTLPGEAFLTAGANGDIAGMSIKVPAIAGPYNLGDFITQGRIVLRPSDHGISVDFNDVPKMFKGVPTHIQELRIDLPGVAAASGKPFLFNASSCTPFNIVSTMTPYTGANATSNIPYQATGCPSRGFAPTIAFAASGPSSETIAPAWTIKISGRENDSTLKSANVILPTIMTVNVQGIGTVCEPAQANARACPSNTSIGTVTVNTPLLPAPVTGNVFVARSISGSTLPDLLIEIPAPIDMQVRGANKFINQIQIQSTFDNLPDLIWSEMTMQIAGGPKGLIGLRSNGKCGSAQSTFGSHSGQAMAADSPVTGIDVCGAGLREICENPTVVVSTKGARKPKNKKSSTSITFSSDTRCAGIKSFSVLMPKGTKVNKKQMLYNKKKKATKKNLKNIVGKFGTKRMQVTDYQAVGSNGLKLKGNLPDGVNVVTMATKNSTVLLPYKTLCGNLKKTGKTKAKYKKCMAKDVVFTFVVTRNDGTAFRFNYKVKAGDKRLK